MSHPKSPMEQVGEILGREILPGTIEDAFRVTGPVEWILSIRETRRELRASRGLQSPAGRLFNAAGLLCNGDSWMMREAILGLVERQILTPVETSEDAKAAISEARSLAMKLAKYQRES